MSCTTTVSSPIPASLDPTCSSPVKPRTSFLDLPRELRDAIYNLVLIHDSRISLLRTRFVGPGVSNFLKTKTSVLEPCDSTAHFTALRCTSRQIDREVQQRFFTANTFHFGAHPTYCDHPCLDTAAARFVFSRVRELVIEYTAAVSGDLFGFARIQISMALRCPVNGDGSWQLRACPSYDWRSYRPPQSVYASAEKAILQFLSLKAPGELLDSEGVNAIVVMLDRELLKVV